jgi:hypothetical protein
MEKTLKAQKKETVPVMRSNENKKRGTGSRYNTGKLRFDLVQPDAHRDMVEVLTKGAEKYEERNWENGMDWSTVLQSLKRHIDAFERGEDYDEETRLLHVAHAACNIHFINAYYYIYPQGDNRPKPWKNLPRVGLDIDEVLCNWLGAWREKWNIIDAPNSWFFDRKILDRFQEMRDADELDTFYSNLEPLIDPKELPIVPHCYITSRPVDTAISETWLDRHGFPTRPVYTVGVNQTKVEVAKEAGIEIFVDDSWDNFVDFNNNGITCYLYDTPHNRVADVGHLRIKTLKDLPFVR